MMRSACLAVLVAATCTSHPTPPARGDSPRPLAKSPPDRPPPLVSSATSISPEDRWLGLAFTHAENVLVVEAAGVDGDGAVVGRVVEEIRGFKTPAVTPLVGLDRGVPSGSRWIVATHRVNGADPHGGVLAALPDTEANRARVRGWALPAWSRTPIVMVVRISGTPVDGVEVEGGRVVFDVVEVLRGTVAPRRITDNAWPFEKHHPLIAGPQLYVLTAWDVEPGPRAAAHAFVFGDSLTPIARADLDGIRRRVAADPRETMLARVARTTRQLQELAVAWTFHEAPIVAETVVATAFEEATGCGGRHFTLSPTRRLRGQAPLGGPLFSGGGHCYHGNEQMGDRMVAAGWQIGGQPAVTIPSAAADPRAIERWMSAPVPRFAALPVRRSAFLPTTSAVQTAPAADSAPFELADAELVPATGEGEWVRFEVVRRREVPAGNGHVHTYLHCRLSRSQERRGGAPAAPRAADWVAPEWMLSGQDLPPLQEGRTYWAVAFGAHGRPSSWPEGRVFVADTFLPGDDGIDLERVLHLAQQAYSGS